MGTPFAVVIVNESYDALDLHLIGDFEDVTRSIGVIDPHVDLCARTNRRKLSRRPAPEND